MPGANRLRSRLRALLYALLLFTPLIAAELFVRNEPGWMIEDLRRYHSASDARKLLFAARDGACPQTLVLGTSMSDRTLVETFLEVPQDSTFTFAAGGMRPNNLLMQWRWVVDQGCVPERLFLELSPLLFNVREGGKPHDGAFLSFTAWRKLPDGFTALRGYRTQQLIDSFTYDRLLLLRRRREIGHAIDRHTGLGEVLRGPGPIRDRKRPKKLKKLKRLPLHGHMRGVRGRGMTSKEARVERKRRQRSVGNGKYQHIWSSVQLEAYRILVAEAREAGTHVVLHSPPMSAIYLDLMVKAGVQERWCEEVAEYERSELPWYRAIADPRYDRGDFFDWYHLDRRSSGRYADRFLEAVQADAGWVDAPWCE